LIWNQLRKENGGEEVEGPWTIVLPGTNIEKLSQFNAREDEKRKINIV